MINYLYNQYFKSKKKELKKYYFDLYLKEIFKKIPEDETINLENYFSRDNCKSDLIIIRAIYDFETMHFNFIAKAK